MADSSKNQTGVPTYECNGFRVGQKYELRPYGKVINFEENKDWPVVGWLRLISGTHVVINAGNLYYNGDFYHFKNMYKLVEEPVIQTIHVLVMDGKLYAAPGYKAQYYAHVTDLDPSYLHKPVSVQDV